MQAHFFLQNSRKIINILLPIIIKTEQIFGYKANMKTIISVNKRNKEFMTGCYY